MKKQSIDHAHLLVLSLLAGEDMYGYQMIVELARRSDHTFEMKEGTLYPVLHGLERQGLVEAYQQTITDGDTGRTNESFIHGLMAYIDVTVIGQTSEGSNVVLGCFACPAYPQYVIYPVVAAYATADETADPSQRITPDLEADERTNEVTAYKALGDTAELMLSRAIDVVINGLPTDDEGGEPVTE